MTTNPLDAIQARADKATEGPWRLGGSGIIAVAGVEYITSCVRTDPDAEFIAHAREDVPKLVRAIREVETIMDQLDIDRADGRIVMPSQIQRAVRDTIREALG